MGLDICFGFKYYGENTLRERLIQKSWRVFQKIAKKYKFSIW
jgi:hypothetical protein